MFAQVTVFTVHRNNDLRLDQIMHRLKIGAVCVTGYVIQVRTVINHINAQFGQLVHDADNALFVARNRFRREQEKVAFLQFDPEVFAPCQLGRGRAAFALGPCHDQHQVFTRNVIGVFNRNNRGEVFQDTRFNSCFDHAAHRAAHQNDGTARFDASLGQRF